MIQPFLIQQVVNFIDKLASKAILSINGKVIELPIFKTVIENNEIKKFVYVDSEITGTITNITLVDSQGQALQSRVAEIEKDEDGLVIAFKIACKVEETG